MGAPLASCDARHCAFWGERRVPVAKVCEEYGAAPLGGKGAFPSQRVVKVKEARVRVGGEFEHFEHEECRGRRSVAAACCHCKGKGACLRDLCVLVPVCVCAACVLRCGRERQVVGQRRLVGFPSGIIR